ncbi:uncharacterized protein [Argopecten irradians]|uniref:uncharacterized protein n=1 Tax=Argopecten irradians TaxID=31199 RepID=UPI003715A6BC
MLLGRRRTARVCTYGGVLMLVFVLFIMLQALVTRDDVLNDFASVGSSRVFSSDTGLSIFDYPADDQRLVNYVRDVLIKQYHRSSTEPPYNLTLDRLNSDYSRGQSKIIDEHLNKKNVGFFVDVGAGDGESNSVTLFFERERTYNGLLIEPYPGRYKTLLTKHRKAHTLQACLRTNRTGNVKEYMAVKERVSTVVPCLWLETILAATGQKVIDILSINVRDEEEDIVRIIPFHKLDIRVVSIEFSHDTNSYIEIVKYMAKIDYVAIHQIVYHPLHKVDFVFAKKTKVKK